MSNKPILPAWNYGQKLVWKGSPEVYGLPDVVRFHSSKIEDGVVYVTLLPDCGNMECKKRGHCGSAKLNSLKPYRP
jgi:hypothetical protein